MDILFLSLSWRYFICKSRKFDSIKKTPYISFFHRYFIRIECWIVNWIAWIKWDNIEIEDLRSLISNSQMYVSLLDTIKFIFYIHFIYKINTYVTLLEEFIFTYVIQIFCSKSRLRNGFCFHMIIFKKLSNTLFVC